MPLPDAPTTRPAPHQEPPRRTSWFGRLEIGWDERVLEPREWTTAQSRWAAALLRDMPPGPVLELCAGAGHIGLLAVAGNRRRLVSVDVDPVATAHTTANAADAGMAEQVTARTETIEAAAEHGTGYVLVVADPPWVPSARVPEFPDDPVLAIDGGPDGVEPALACVRTAARVLRPGGRLLLQVGTEDQLDGPVTHAAEAHGLRVLERQVHPRGVLGLLG